VRRVLEDFDGRTGALSRIARFFQKPTPARGGWWFTLGSVALFLGLLQAATGALLATAYAPTPDHARASVWFIEKRMPAGSLVRGLHSWGASAILVIAVLHLLRVLYHGAYKDPRRENWWLGLGLLAVLLAFAFTGYLLPWDQKGYWATVVGVRIMDTVPGIGHFAARLLSGGPRVGASALSRFAAIHFVFLPILALALVFFHLLLLQRHGHAGLPGDESPREAFFPGQVARDAVVIAVAFLAVVALAHFLPAPLEATADPSDSAYVPRPDWYFLSLFQLLHYFPGRSAVIGAVVVPGLIAIFLALLPVIDRSELRQPRQRRIWIGASAAIFAGAGLLTALAAVEAPAPNRLATTEPPPPPLAFVSAADLRNYDLSSLAPAIAHGGKLIATKKCLECHLVNGDGNAKGIELRHEAERRTRDWLIAHFRDPQDLVPHSKMPPYDNLPEKDLQDLASYLLALP
jgi:ubiquinol-cytochrome c reductase cytochrome b subunit